MQKRPTLSDLFPLPAESKRLQVFLGSWEVEGTLTFMNRTYSVKGMVKFSSAAAGWGVLATAKLEIEGLGLYEETDLLSFSRDEEICHFFAVTNTGAAYDHKGNWSDEKTIGFSYEGLRDGKRYEELLEITVKDRDRIAISERDSIGGQVTTAMQVTLSREPG
jgi:hypothetical protein